MSLKPAKQSDLNKEWMKRRRDRSISISPEYHLIVTEDTDTAPLYFQRIKEIINTQYKERIQIDIRGEGDNTLSLLEKAHRKAETNPNQFKHVWVVYDTDDFPATHINETVDKCKVYSSKDTEYHAIWSNQCIELWFLLHFCFLQSDIHRDGYYPKITKYLNEMGEGSYQKNRKDMFDILLPSIDIAIGNSKKLELINKGKLPSQAAPGTKVHVLIEKLKPYIKARL